jgi:hypothetical protein
MSFRKEVVMPLIFSAVGSLLCRIEGALFIVLVDANVYPSTSRLDGGPDRACTA